MPQNEYFKKQNNKSAEAPATTNAPPVEDSFRHVEQEESIQTLQLSSVQECWKELFIVIYSDSNNWFTVKMDQIFEVLVEGTTHRFHYLLKGSGPWKYTSRMLEQNSKKDQKQ